MTTDSIVRAGQPQILQVVLIGGLIVGILDAANATIFWYVAREVPPSRIFQSIAAGLLGKEAFAGGMKTAWLGAGLHFFIAFSIATVYGVACRVWPVMLRNPARWGIGYGAAVYLVMNYVVVPLSRVPSAHHTVPWFWSDFLGHLFTVGLPVALMASWSAREKRAGSR